MFKTPKPHNYTHIFLSLNSTIMTRNIKTVIIEIPNSTILKRLNSTPTFSRLSKAVLKVGANRENVNHKTYSDMLRLYPLLGVTVTEVSI